MSTDRLLVLKKPCDPAEVKQMPAALVAMWSQHREPGHEVANGWASREA